MTIDQTKVGETTARLMDQLEERFGDEEQARIKDVFLVVAIEHSGDLQSAAAKEASHVLRVR